MPKRRTNKNIKRRRKTRRKGRTCKKYKGGADINKAMDELNHELNTIIASGLALARDIEHINDDITNENDSNKRKKLEQIKHNKNKELLGLLDRINKIMAEINTLAEYL